MNRKIKRICQSMLSLVLVGATLLGNLSILGTAHAKVMEVNIAPDASISVDNNSGSAGKLVDKDQKSDWQYQQSFKDIPNKTIEIRMKMKETGNTVNQVKVFLGSADWSDTQVDVEVFYAQNGITSDMPAFGTKQTASLGGEVTIRPEQAVSASDIYVKISNPQFKEGATHTDFTLWPSVREVEVYALQDVKLSDYNNIAAQATITTDGRESSTDGSANLVDNNLSTLYKFHDAKLTEEKFVQLAYAEPRRMDACTINFEHVDSEPYDYKFVFSIVGVKPDNTEVVLVDHQQGNRTDKSALDFQFTEADYKAVKIVMHQTTNNVGDKIGWPAIAEFALFGSEVKMEDSESVAFGKPVHTNMNRGLSGNIVDGSTKSGWTSSMYPSYADIDLLKNYNLSEIQVFTPANGYSQYKIYTSLDGRNFTRLAEKTSTASCPAEGEKYDATGTEARFVRVYITYNSAGTNSVLNEVRVLGTESGTPIQHRSDINVQPYGDPYTFDEADTIQEVKDLITRRLKDPKYVSWFELDVAPNSRNSYDYFQLDNAGDGKIRITGNDGVSLATGLNYYLKYYCSVNVSQVGDQINMPATAPALPGSVYKETKASVRYAYNYCTLSYSMPFYGQKEWQDELDWLAMNGVNVVLDATAQEEVWRRFLDKLGYTHEDSKDFVAGPAYYAWAYMANLSGFGGPVHDSWFEKRTELARENHKTMRRLGMEPVLQGYSGMVPNDLAEHDAAAAQDIIKQGTWCAFQRPDMLKTDTATYKKYAKLFYEAQKEVYGPAKYFATDPFHEGGNTGGMNPTVIAREVVETMIRENGQDAVWIIQSWQGNPTSALLAGLEGHRENALVLDLYAEKTPHYNEPHPGGAYGNTAEFDGTPWVFCMLNNFGGRLGLHGHLDNLVNNIPTVFNTQQHVAGIGITPEASVNNPLLYEFLFEGIWQDDANSMQALDIDQWLKDYGTRRYGAESNNAWEALKILKETVYKASLNMRGQGAPESIVNARPRFDIGAASTWGNSVIGYDKAELERAAALMLADYDKLKDSEGYQYDLATILQQILSNTAQNQLRNMKNAFNSKNVDKFTAESNRFLEIIDAMEEVTSTSKYYLLGTWVEQAKRLADGADDFAADIYEWNAKALITTWGSYNQSEAGGLHDYSNRQWSGLLKDFYKVRWQKWIDNRIKELNKQPYNDAPWFPQEWAWTWEKTAYTETPSGNDLQALGERILTDYSVVTPASKDDNDIPVDQITVEAGSFQPGNATEGDPRYVLDNNPGTIWHTKWSGDPMDKHYLIFTLNEKQLVSGLRYMGRGGNVNGAINSYKVFIRGSETEEWQEVVANGQLDRSNGEWQILPFDGNKQYMAKQIKFLSTDAYTSQAPTLFSAAAEMRVLKGHLAELKGHSLSLGEDIGVNFILKVHESVAADQAAYMEFSAPLNNGKVVKSKVFVKDADALGGSQLKFSCRVYAPQMAAPITANLMVSDGKGGMMSIGTWEYSVQDYAKYILDANKKDPSLYAREVPLIKAMLNYGARSQQFLFAQNPGVLANSILDEADKVVPHVTAQALDQYKATKSGTVNGLTYVGSSVVLDSSMVIRHYFQPEAGKTASDYTFTVNGVSVETKPFDKYLLVEVPDIKPQLMDEMHTLNVTANGVSSGLNIQYCVLSYVRGVLASTNPNHAELVPLVEAMYQYNTAANTYAG